MSIFSSLQMAGNALQAFQIGLHVVGNNIANANTPGYVREKTIYATAPVQKLGNLTIGLGVEIAGIVQSIDKFTESRLRDAGGDRANAETQEAAYRNLEVILDSLGENNISTKLTDFFNSIQLINDNHDDIALRNLAISAGEQLTQTVNTLHRRVNIEYGNLNVRVNQIASEINNLTEEIRQLNLQIVKLEGGGASGSDAGGLRSQRGVALKRLAELANIETNEAPTGVINISLNGEFLVFEGTRRQVAVEQLNTGESVNNKIVFAENGDQLQVNAGELSGVYEARDTILGGFLNGLDEFVGALAFEFNKVYSQGQGLEGFESVTSTYQVDDPQAALSEAGLEFTPRHGEFNIIVFNKETSEAETHTISIDLLGTNGSITTLESLAAQIDAISGVAASVNIDNELVIASESPADIDIRFERDSSGVLAALGINTFFTGSKANDLGVNRLLLDGETAGARFAAGLRSGNADGKSENGANALELAGLQDKTLSDLNGRSIGGLYDQLIDLTTQGASTTAAVADGLRTFEGTLEAGAQAVSGVNLDEEAIDMIQLQRAYQASARFISTMTELLEILVSL